MNHFDKKEDGLYFRYFSEHRGFDWIYDKIETQGFAKVNRVFLVEAKDLILLEDEEELQFKIAEKKGEYYQFNRKILEIQYDLYMSYEFNFKTKHFVDGTLNLSYPINIFQKFEDYIEEDSLYIGGNKADLTVEQFLSIIGKFPKRTEMTKYKESREALAMQSYFPKAAESVLEFDKWLDKHERKDVVSHTIPNIIRPELFQKGLDKLETMLEKEDFFLEKHWQLELFKVLQIIFPQYISLVPEIAIPIGFQKQKSVRFDFLAITAYGNIEIIELKRPHGIPLLAERPDHDNYYPHSYLSKVVMQTEKYLYHLSKLGYHKEGKLFEKIAKKTGLDINSLKNIKPKALIIMGRTRNFNDQQMRDYEVIKQSFSKDTEIVSYDELIERFKIILRKLEESES